MDKKIVNFINPHSSDIQTILKIFFLRFVILLGGRKTTDLIYIEFGHCVLIYVTLFKFCNVH